MRPRSIFVDRRALTPPHIEACHQPVLGGRARFFCSSRLRRRSAPRSGRRRSGRRPRPLDCTQGLATPPATVLDTVIL
jgi:hypothetical protein